MATEITETNGWYAYKIAVLKQLEILTSDIAEVKDCVSRIDKEVASYKYIPEQLTEVKVSIRNIEKELTTFSTITKSDRDHTAIQIKLDSFDTWKSEQIGKSSVTSKTAIAAVIMSSIIVIIQIASLFTK